ncbi:hypothetical protein CBR_g6340 [Chara braunii]|uniref:Uncharacterized protein n=1 Tax=Chara braunii TaxID=69332 RepID=A0A388KJN9_CHABU|nr:hypothetical protein CBR_g6340 [Chara braunii]|eukprot:GBG70208.1 hypothetical protein CBR_g6340 [Chara braunii]
MCLETTSLRLWTSQFHCTIVDPTLRPRASGIVDVACTVKVSLDGERVEMATPGRSSQKFQQTPDLLQEISPINIGQTLSSMSSQRRLLEQHVDGDDLEEEEQGGEEEDEEEGDEQENAGVCQEGEHEQGVPYDERVPLTADDLFALPYEFEFLDQDWTVQRLADGLFLQRLLPTARVYDNVDRCIMFAYIVR